MENLKSLLCESNIAMIICFVVDAILILAAIALFMWYFVKNARKQSNKVKSTTEIEQINDDTYIIAKDEEEQAEEVVYKADNAVEHFSNQLAGINEPVTNELKSTAVIVNHEVEAHVKKPVTKE